MLMYIQAIGRSPTSLNTGSYMMIILSSLMTPHLVVIKTYGAGSDNKVGIMTSLGYNMWRLATARYKHRKCGFKIRASLSGVLLKITTSTCILFAYKLLQNGAQNSRMSTKALMNTHVTPLGLTMSTGH